MKKEFKGTPGNWIVGKCYGAVVSDQKTNRKRYSERDWESEKEHYGGYIICESVASNADAQLIATAPELLEALIAMINIVDDTVGLTGWHRNGDIAYWSEFEDVDKAKELINKIAGHDNNNQNSTTNS